jgi:uracil-DNA glycosylase
MPRCSEKTLNHINEISGAINNKVAVVLACPGKVEYEEGEICSGETGENLSKLLKFANKQMPEIFLYNDICEYRITNASMKVYPNESTTRTVPYFQDITDHDNIKRLAEKLKGMEYIILLGKSAIRAYSELANSFPEFQAKTPIIHGHLSLQRINSSIKLDEDLEKLTQSERSAKRLEMDFCKFLEKAQMLYANYDNNE